MKNKRILIYISVAMAPFILAMVLWGMPENAKPLPMPSSDNVIPGLQQEKRALEIELFNTTQWLNSVNITLSIKDAEIKRQSDMVASCEARNNKLVADYNNLNTSWQESNRILAEITSGQQSLESSRALAVYWEAEIKRQLNEQVIEHDKVLASLKLVDDREDITTTSNLTTEKRVAFYEMWDIWYEILLKDEGK